MIRDYCASSHIILKYLPRYTPEKNPIELCFSKLRKLLQRASKGTQRDLRFAIDCALPDITAEDTQGFFKKCGYDIRSTTTEDHPKEGEELAAAADVAICMVLAAFN